MEIRRAPLSGWQRVSNTRVSETIGVRFFRPLPNLWERNSEAEYPVFTRAVGDFEIPRSYQIIGPSPTGKAAGFDPAMSRFDSYRPRQI